MKTTLLILLSALISCSLFWANGYDFDRRGPELFGCVIVTPLICFLLFCIRKLR